MNFLTVTVAAMLEAIHGVGQGEKTSIAAAL